MAEKTLEQIEEIAKKEFPEWGHLIDQEPTIMKNFKGKEGKLIGVSIDEEGASITGNANEQGDIMPVSLEEWDKRYWFHLNVYDHTNKTLTESENQAKHFDQKTLEEIRTFTKRWLEVIEV